MYCLCYVVTMPRVRVKFYLILGGCYTHECGWRFDNLDARVLCHLDNGCFSIIISFVIFYLYLLSVASANDIIRLVMILLECLRFFTKTGSLIFIWDNIQKCTVDTWSANIKFIALETGRKGSINKFYIY